MPYSTLDLSDEKTVVASKEAPLLALKLWPNRSLPKTGFFYLLLTVWSLMTIPMLALVGSASFWGVVPFCLFTLLLLYLSLRKNYDDGKIMERLLVWSDLITVERVEVNKSTKKWEAIPYWSTVNLYKESGPVDKYLTLKGNGREIELGSFLSPEEREKIYSQLKPIIKSS